MANLFIKITAVSALALTLTGCEEFTGNTSPNAEISEDGVPMIEQDVESPEVFSSNDQALWDGRPSLGGIWVAAPDVGDPERIVIRNPSNGKSTIGALFRRERFNPGPPLQLSSDAAKELGVLAGQPTKLEVVALRRQSVPDPSFTPPPVEAASAADGEGVATEEIGATTLDDSDFASVAAAAIEETPAPTAAPAPAPEPQQQTSPLSKPYIQIGIFAVEANANKTATMLRNNGITPTVKPTTSRGRQIWRVLAGPAQSSAERRRLLSQVRGLGFGDAYSVSR